MLGHQIVTRQEALALGLKYYFTGRPCALGHLSEHYARNGNCQKCRDLADKRYKQKKRNRYAEKMARQKAEHLKSLKVVLFHDAIRAGMPRYFTGESCKAGHIDQRYTRSGHCLECHRIAARAERRRSNDEPVPAPSKVDGAMAKQNAAQVTMTPNKFGRIVSRDEAGRIDKKRYFTGIPCVHGHIDERAVLSGACIACSWKQRTGSDEARNGFLARADIELALVEPALPEWPRVTRDEARAGGQKRYFEGKTCKGGHVAPRYIGNHECVICSRVKNQERYANDPEFRQRRIDYEVERNRRPDVREMRLVKMSQYSKTPKVRNRILTRMKVDLLFRFKSNLKTLLRITLKKHSHKKQSRMQDILGCSIENFMVHIERQFVIGMTWENYGEWETDHIVALKTAKNGEDVVALFHHTNLRPLWKKDNRSKGAQALYLI